jgi:hypothetical protein
VGKKKEQEETQTNFSNCPPLLSKSILMFKEPSEGRRLQEDGPDKEKETCSVQGAERPRLGREVGRKELSIVLGFPCPQPGALQRVQAGNQEQVIKG